MNIAEMNK